MTPLEALTSYNSYNYHKCELPAENLLPPAPKDVAELVQQIEGLLSALRYRVEDYLNLPDEEQLSGVNPAAWSFFHEVIALLPRDLDPESINEALLILHARSQSPSRQMLAEVMNPASAVPPPAIEKPSDTTIPVSTNANSADDPSPKADSNRARTYFQQIQDAIFRSAKRVPDPAPPSGEVEERVPPRSALKGQGKEKATAKTKRKGKSVRFDETAEWGEWAELKRESERAERQTMEDEAAGWHAQLCAERDAQDKRRREKKAKEKAATAAAAAQPQPPAPTARPPSARIAAAANTNATAGPSTHTVASLSTPRAPRPVIISPVTGKEFDWEREATPEIDHATGLFTGRSSDDFPELLAQRAATRERKEREAKERQQMEQGAAARELKRQQELERQKRGRPAEWDAPQQAPAPKKRRVAGPKRRRSPDSPSGSHSHHLVVGGVTYTMECDPGKCCRK
ncbi:hypothetical protein DFH08DRAFT_989439 [Mycena albidolilacea]|uniref:Uncharacterized protein n=1 Tax=Mycena albidolilacea TaxID=1033008 RepID=A0AAD6Z0H0_9AGAR|nr:hypothetical protein DFH08DRAFT_989439 [Mycena albidolilacea]